jgi:tetratricopeptide (TPR) repeat protein
VAHLAGFAIPIATAAEERERLTEAALAAEQLSETYLFQNDSTRAFLAALEATNAAAGLGPSPALARGYATLSVAFGYVPLPQLVAAYAERAERTAEGTGDRRAIGFVAFLRGLTALNEARCDDATALLEKAERIADEVQDRRRQEECMALLGSAAIFAGRWPVALARYAELSASARRSNNAQGEIWARSGRAQCLILLGDGAEAAEILAEDEALIQESGDRAQQITHGQVALAHLIRGDRAAARRIAERTLDLMRRGPPAAFHCLHGYVASCEVLLAEEEAATSPAERRALGREAREACRELRRYARIFPLGRPDALRVAGIVDWLDGRRDRARRSWQEAIEAAGRLRLPGEEGRARYELGRRLGRGDPEGARQLRRAAEIFTALEIDFWRERAERAR